MAIDCYQIEGRAAATRRQLQRWAETYGGQQFARLGYVGQDKLTVVAPTSSNVDADRIEAIVQRMEAQGRWREARVLRAEHFMRSLPERERLQRLSRIGVRIGRSAYYAYLKSALAFLDGALGSSTISATRVRKRGREHGSA